MPIRAILATSVADRGPAVFAASTSSLALATIFCVARMITRIGIVKRCTLDDYLICLSMVLAVGLTLTVAMGVKFGLGRHYQDIADADQDSLNVSAYAFSVLYVCSILSLVVCSPLLKAHYRTLS